MPAAPVTLTGMVGSKQADNVSYPCRNTELFSDFSLTDDNDIIRRVF